MLYSAWDCQCNCYFYTGRNSKTREKCIKDIRVFLEDGEDFPNSTDEDIIFAFEVVIHEHLDKIKEDD